MYASARFFYCRYIVIVQALSAITVGWTSARLSFFNRTEAQEIKDVKETLVVDYFMRFPNVPVAYADAIRRGGIVGFAERGRHNVVDAEQLNRLKPYSRMWEVGSPETATEEYSRLISQRARLIEAVGARYIVTGTVTGYTFSHESKDGKDSFKSVFVLLLSGYDILTGKSLSPEEIKLSGQGEKPAVADGKAIESMKYPLLFYIDRNYKFETRILELGEPDKHGKVKDIYINRVEDIGIRRGDLFRVMFETKERGVRHVGT